MSSDVGKSANTATSDSNSLAKTKRRRSRKKERDNEIQLRHRSSSCYCNKRGSDNTTKNDCIYFKKFCQRKAHPK